VTLGVFLADTLWMLKKILRVFREMAILPSPFFGSSLIGQKTRPPHFGQNAAAS